MKKIIFAVLALGFTSFVGIYSSTQRSFFSGDRNQIEYGSPTIIKNGGFSLRVDLNSGFLHSFKAEEGDSSIIGLSNVQNYTEGVSIAYDSDNLPAHFSGWELKSAFSENENISSVSLKCKGKNLIRTISLSKEGEITVYDSLVDKKIGESLTKKEVKVRVLEEYGYDFLKVKNKASKITNTDLGGDVSFFCCDNGKSNLFVYVEGKGGDINYREFGGNYYNIQDGKIHNGRVKEVNYSYNEDKVLKMAFLPKKEKFWKDFEKYGFSKMENRGFLSPVAKIFKKILFLFASVLGVIPSFFLTLSIIMIILIPFLYWENKNKKYFSFLAMNLLSSNGKTEIVKRILTIVPINIFIFLILSIFSFDVFKTTPSLGEFNFFWIENISRPDTISLVDLVPAFAFLKKFLGITQILSFISMSLMFVGKDRMKFSKMNLLKIVMIYIIIYRYCTNIASLIILPVYFLFKRGAQKIFDKYLI